MRFTVQRSAALAAAANAGVTPAPPDDTKRRLSTACDEKSGAFINPTKNVGGPIMNVMCSRSITRSASDGSHFAMSTVFIGTTPAR